MNVTTRDIEDFNAIMLNKIKTDIAYAEALKAKFNNLKRIELETIERQATVCHVGGKIEDASFLERVEELTDPVKLKHIMDQQFYNYNVMKAVGCAVYSVFYGISEKDGNLGRIFHLKQQISNLHQIGDESVSGYALTGEMKDAKDLFLLKTPRTEGAVQDLAHELFLGLFVLNDLRKTIPNFAFVYGGLRCSKPLIDQQTKQVISWCSNEESTVPYVIYENISPSKSFGDYVRKASVGQFYSLFTQFVLATTIASNLVGWTHYDSHSGNWLVRENTVPGLGKDFCIPYPGKTGKTIYVNSQAILTAIDYGQATGEYKGRDFGIKKVGFRAYGVIDGPWPLHDVYKLMMFLALDCLESRNMPVYRELEKLFRFFNKSESLEYALKNQGPNKDLYYILPPLSDTIRYTMDDVFVHMMSVWNLTDIVTEKPQYNILECSDRCYTFQAVLKDSSDFANVLHVPDFPSFYDAALYLNKYSVDDYDDLIKKFNYEDAKVKFNKLVAEKKAILNRMTIHPSIKGKKLNMAATMNQIADNHRNLFETVSAFEDLELLLKIGNSVANLFHDKALIAEIQANRKFLKSKEPGIVAQIKTANDNYKYIYGIISQPEWRVLGRNYSWYANSAGDVVGLDARFDKDAKELFTEMRLPSSLFNAAAIQSEVVTEEAKEEKRNITEVAKPRVRVKRDKQGNVAKIHVA